jgi:GTP-binding protein Era
MKSGFISIIGRPNVGKSTLLNALVGKKISIVSSKPQTTRLAIQGIYHAKNLQIVFVDTPGIHKPQAKLGELMNAQAFTSLKGIDGVVLLVDASIPFGKGDEFIVTRLRFEQNIIVAFNKIDQTNITLMTTLKEKYATVLPQAKMIEISALKRIFLDDFIKLITTLLKRGPAYFPADVTSNLPEEFHLAEFIREKVLISTYQEVPHSVAVIIDQYKVKEDKRTVYASIIVEKPSQKGIIIGKDGGMIKRIRMQVIHDVEKNMGLKLSLELFVKVEPKWRDSLTRMKEYGLS